MEADGGGSEADGGGSEAEGGGSERQSDLERCGAGTRYVVRPAGGGAVLHVRFSSSGGVGRRVHPV